MTDTRAVVEDAIRAGTCLGVQVRVMLRGQTVMDFAVGEESPHVPLTTGSVVPWFSASKLLATLAFARAWELGILSPNDLVSQHLPEFTEGGKDSITIEHLWAHTAPLRAADRAAGGAFAQGWDALIALICAADADPGWVAGQRAAYLGHAGYLLIAEIIARRSGAAFADFLHAQVTEPLGLTAALGGMSGVRVVQVPYLGPAAAAARVAQFDVAQGYPSACVAGPFGEAATAVEVLRMGGRYGGRRLLREETCAALVRDHRPAGVVDEAMGVPVRWGLGLMLDSFDFGRHCSPRTFGHTGGSACLVLADPDAEVTIAAHFNGNAPLQDRIRRDHALCTAVYTDLALAHPKDPGRDHTAPVLGRI